MKFSKTSLGLLLALLMSNAVVLYGSLEWGVVRFVAALTLTFGLPGWAWLPALGWMRTSGALERFILLIGFSSLLSALALFIALSLPGPFTETPNLIALNVLTFSGLLYQLVLKPAQSDQSRPGKIEWPARTVLVALLIILAVAAVTRLTRLSYGEFHEDELENMRLIVRAYKGEEYAAFLDSKGPIHWLLPASLWYLNGWLDEGLARTPFALASLLLIPTIYALGQRLSGRAEVGLLAAGFVALNGFFVAYARFVENQSLIVFWGALALWFAYRYYRENIASFLLYTALTLAIGLIAHPDMLLYLPPFAYLILYKMWGQDLPWRQQWPWFIGAGILFMSLVTLFYVPYLTDPQIGLVYQYFASDRIGDSLFYNQVSNLFDQDQLYSTRYHAPLLTLLLTWLLARNFARWGWPGWTIFSGLGLAIITTVLRPNIWMIGALDLAFAPYALLTLALIFLPTANFETRLLFLWLSAPLGALLFLAKDAADHVQIAYPAWALLAALALVDIWALLSVPGAPDATRRPGLEANIGFIASPPELLTNLSLPRLLASTKPALKITMVLSLSLIIALILGYQYLAFAAPVTTYWQAKISSESDPASIYNRLYGSIPRPRKIFSNPRLGGWKVVGYLWATGLLSGDFRSINESFAVPIWYTFQTPRSCYDDPQHYWLRRDWQGWPDEEQALKARGYQLTRIILVDQEPKLHLYEKNVPAGEPEIIDSEDYRHKFDRLATPIRFAHDETPDRPASLNFGDKLLLRGYDLPQKSIRAGDLLPVTVYWESLAPMDTRYRGFMHVVDSNETRLAQHDDDPACRLLTTDMRPGQRSSRQFRLRLEPTLPPGTYRVIFGLYDPETLERLPIWDNLASQPAGDHVVLGQVEVE